MLHRTMLTLYILLLAVHPIISVAQPPFYKDGSASQEKIDYCATLVHRYGYLSQKINSDYYGIGVKPPIAGKWSLRIKEPGWFSGKLFITFKQITKEKYEDYEHSLYCMWEKNTDRFEFVISHHHFRAAPFCYRRISDVRTDDRFFFNPIICP